MIPGFPLRSQRAVYRIEDTSANKNRSLERAQVDQLLVRRELWEGTQSRQGGKTQRKSRREGKKDKLEMGKRDSLRLCVFASLR